MKILNKTSYLLCAFSIISIILCTLFWFTIKTIEPKASDNWSDNFQNVQINTENSTVSDVTPPSWIQGEWAVTTEYGSHGIKIQGNTMWEVESDGTMTSGSFRYDADEHRIYYKDEYFDLDMTNQRISFGGGYYFHRI